MNLFVPTTLFLLAAAPLVAAALLKKHTYKKIALFVNIASVLGICVVVFLSSAITVFAADAPSETAAANAAGVLGGVSVGAGLGMLAAALVTALSCVGAGIAVASSASAAIGAMSENSKTFGKSLIFVALAEGVALYGLIISQQILGLLK